MNSSVLDIDGPTRGSKWRILCVLYMKMVTTGTNKKRSRYFTHEIWSYEGADQHYSDALQHADTALRTEAKLYTSLRDQNDEGDVYYVLQVEVNGEWQTVLHQTVKVINMATELITGVGANPITPIS